MTERAATERAATAAAVCWTVLAAALAASTFAASTDEGRAVVAAFTLVGVGAAAAAAACLSSGRPRLAGALLVVSAVTPTSFAYLPNLVALLGGAWLVLRPASRPVTI